MKTYLDCLPCFIRQAHEAAKLCGLDQKSQKKVIEEVASILPSFDLGMSPPEIARSVYGLVGGYTNGKDAYEDVKIKCNKKVMDIYPNLLNMVTASKDPLQTALRLAVAGNVIDYGLPHGYDLQTEIEDCLKKDFAIFDYNKFVEDINKAEKVLYILDNAGEIVFDKLLVSQLKSEVVCVVREKPIINDVTMKDAEYVGLTKISKVISSGSEVPGTLTDTANDEFMECYRNADVIISKGQGNFETLSDKKMPIYFILKAKCKVVADHIGCEVGDIILMKQNREN